MRSLAFLAIIASGSVALLAQTSTLRGTVTDQSGAAMSGATVKLKSTAKGWSRTVSSSDTGDYVFTQVPPEAYNISVEIAGFVPQEQQNVILQVNQEARLDFLLKVGSTQDKVVVQAEAPLVQSENATTGAVVEERKIKELPLNGREFWQLAQLSPMVMSPPQNSSLGFRGGFNVAGSPEVNNAFIMDGIDNNDQTTGQPTHRPSVDGRWSGHYCRCHP